MKQLNFTIILLCSLFYIQAKDLSYLDKNTYTVHYNQSYGNNERNKYDIIVPQTDNPHGLVIFIHGGGFKKGDKKVLYKRKEDVKYFLDNDIAVATINYRFYKNDDSLGVRVCLQDIQRAIQFLRFNANKYNIDKKRVGCYGVSAGAGSSLYFALNNDFAIPGDTTLLGESTRVKCAGAIATQSTYNVFRWKKVVPYMRLVVLLKRKQIYHGAANFYGFSDCKPNKMQIKEVAKELDMLAVIDAGDPPIYLMNLLKGNFPKNDNIVQHHRKHAVAVSKKLNKYDVKNYLYTYKNASSEKNIDYKMREFMVEYINK